MSAARVLIVNDQALFREALRTLFSTRPEVEVVGEAANGLEALARVVDRRPDVVLMDMKMPRLDGISAIRRLRVQSPNIKIVVLTTFDDDDLVFDCLRAGAAGYLLKDVSSEVLVEAILAVARGHSFLQPAVAAKVVAEFLRLAVPPTQNAGPPLSHREGDVLRLLARGACNKEIARALSLAEGTVKNHATNIFTKLGVSDRMQAALRARDLGLF